MKVVGLDPALAKTGVAIWDDEEVDAYTITSPRKLRGGERLDWLHWQIKDAVEGAWLVATEGYAYNAQGRGVHMGELGGVIKRLLYEDGINLYAVPPASVKKLATGNGAASKEQVLYAAAEQLGYEGISDHEADALWVLHFALIKEGIIGRKRLTPNQLAAIDSVTWEKQ